MKKLSIVLALMLTFAASSALAADGKALYAKCIGCHGADGSKTAQSKALKGQKPEAIIAAMNGYKAKKYGGPKKGVMEGLAAPLSEADIKALAEYIGKL